MNQEKYEKGAQIPLTDDGNAFRITHYFRDTLRYVKALDQWFNWDGRRWNRATAADLVRVGRAVAACVDHETTMCTSDEQRRLHRAHATRTHGAKSIKAMIDLARGDSTLWQELEDFDADPYLVNFMNGTVDVRTRALRPHNPENMITDLTRHDYRADADCPLYRKLIARTFQRAGLETAEFMQKVLGYGALVGKNPEQIIVIIIGDENCGKSKAIEILAEVIGPDYAHKSKTDLISRVARGHHSSERFSIIGKRFVTISETSSLFNLDESTVKELTGDTRITAYQLYKGIEINPRVTWTIFLASNGFPNVLEWDGAIKRRVIAVPAGPRLDEREVIKDLDERILREEAEGVLAYLVDGAYRWHRDWQEAQGSADRVKTGLALPLGVELFGETYAQSQDHIGVFIGECVVLDEDCQPAHQRGAACRTPKKDVHDAFKRWRGVGEVSNRNKLYADVGKLSGVSYDSRCFTGLCLRDPTWIEMMAQAASDK